MAHRSIEEVIQTIAPSRQAGIPNPPTIGVGVSSDNGDLTSALSQAGDEEARGAVAVGQRLQHAGRLGDRLRARRAG